METDSAFLLIWMLLRTLWIESATAASKHTDLRQCTEPSGIWSRIELVICSHQSARCEKRNGGIGFGAREY
jgi:hypothetical protein